ncbi:hypothetical protein ACFE04_007301 [Oxalis oulophora]
MSFPCRRLSRRLSHLCSARLSPLCSRRLSLCSRRPLPLFPSSSPSVPVVSRRVPVVLSPSPLCSNSRHLLTPYVPFAVDCLLPLFPSPSIAYSLCSRRRRLLKSILSGHSLCLFQDPILLGYLIRESTQRENEPASKILELCILHLAMSEITVVGTRHQIVINEVVDLAKHFCDGAAPRIINGCLNTFI